MNRNQCTSATSSTSVVEPLLSKVVKLCILSHVTEDAAIEMVRKAYAAERSASREVSMLTEESSENIFILGQILSEWHQNPRFLDEIGVPRALNLVSGEFAELCSAASVHYAPEKILELLTQAGAVEVQDSELRILRRDLIMDFAHPAAVRRAIAVSTAFASTLHHNLTRSVSEPGLFERTVSATRLHKRHIPSLLAYLALHGQSFLEDLDSWMTSRATTDSDATIGVGVYTFVSKT